MIMEKVVLKGKNICEGEATGPILPVVRLHMAISYGSQCAH